MVVGTAFFFNVSSISGMFIDRSPAQLLTPAENSDFSQSRQ
jgi:hypothetical protein